MIRSSAVFIIWASLSAHAACNVCTSFQPGTNWGTVNSGNIREASGLAASARNPGVLWTHNDGPRSRMFGLSTNGALLATCNFNQPVEDFEDIAVGDGYVFIGDIGGSQSLTGTRSQIRILRIAEPNVNLEWAASPVSIDLGQVEVFTFQYPDGGSYDAETLWFDSVSNAVFVVTKEPSVARVFKADVQASTLELVSVLAFPVASGGDISADGSKIALRREDFAMLWDRCDGESLADALARTGTSIPVIGPPTEPNGEGIAFLRDGTGYTTLSEEQNQPIYFFQATCPAGARFTLGLADTTAILGGSVRLKGHAVGYPAPTFVWTFKGDVLPNQTNSFLDLSNVAPSNAGVYRLTASNEHGAATTEATLNIIAKPDLRITEAMSAPTSPPGVSTADWWELTSFENQPVSLGGWRFNDNGGALTDPFVFPQGLTILPKETIVFAEGLTDSQFRAWWGIPVSVRIVTYGGNGFSFGAGGDGIRLWNNFTTDPLDTVASVNFGSATSGVSFNYDPVTGQFGAPSQLGVNGVFRAATANDIGSPGRILAPLSSPVLHILRNESTIRIAFDASIGGRYFLEVLESNGWSPTGDQYVATANAQTFFDKAIATGARFFRVRVE